MGKAPEPGVTSQMSARSSVLVVGGGIGGLTLAAALAGNGIPVDVVEVDPDWPTVGWGLSLTGPALRALATLGLADACIAAGFGFAEVFNCDAAGRPFRVEPLPRLAGPGRPAQVGIGRPALHRVLRERAEELGARTRCGVTVDTLDDDGTRVAVRFTDGTEGGYDLVVGADGVRSTLRGMLGIDITPRYTGQVIWRARVDRPAWHTALHTYSGPEHVAGIMPIGPAQAYVFLAEHAEVPAVLPPEELAGRMRALCAEFNGDFAAVCATITDPADIVRRPVHVLLADAPWHRGRVMLIGDAVHSPSPQLVSGAALAIEDAAVLGGLLADAGGPAALGSEQLDLLLTGFADRRHGRAALVVETSIRASEMELSGLTREAREVVGACFAALAAPI